MSIIYYVMCQSISQAWNSFLGLLLKRIILVLTLMFCIAVGVALSNMSRLSSSLIKSQAVQNAALYATSLNRAIELYSNEAVDRAKTVNGITVTHAYLTQKGAIPLPSTFAIELGEAISKNNVVVGNIGSEKRSKYGIVGSPVNLTYRIESYTRGGQILISEQTLKEAGSAVKIQGQKQVQPKGFKQAITIDDVYGVSGFFNLYLPKEEDVFFLIPEPIPLQYTILQGKHINNIIFQGSLVKLSAKGSEIRALSLGEDSLPSELTNLKLNLLTPHNQAEVREDIYAKVLKNQADNRSFCIHFTAIPVNAQAQLDTLYESNAH